MASQDDPTPKAQFREDFDAALRGRAEETLVLECPEHPDVPLRATYHDGVVTLRCGDDVVFALHVASRKEQAELRSARIEDRRRAWRRNRF